jgi:HD-GYP domain-containing protein (c-di-GMP phosphodiesterase class II)
MERTVLKCFLGLILNNFYKKSWSRNKPLKSLIHADDDDDDDIVKMFIKFA